MNSPYHRVVANIHRTRDNLSPDRKWRYYRKFGNDYFAMHLEDYFPNELRKVADDMEKLSAIELEKED